MSGVPDDFRRAFMGLRPDGWRFAPGDAQLAWDNAEGRMYRAGVKAVAGLAEPVLRNHNEFRTIVAIDELSDWDSL